MYNVAPALTLYTTKSIKKNVYSISFSFKW